MLPSLLTWKSPARDQLIALISDRREATCANDLRKMHGERLMDELREATRQARGFDCESIRILLGRKQIGIIEEYRDWLYDRYGSITPRSEIYYHRMQCVAVDDEDYIGVFRVLPYKWVELESESAA